MEENKNDGMNPGPICVDEMDMVKFGEILLGPLPIWQKEMLATLDTKKIKHEATRAREYLRLTGATCTPDRVHEVLHLRTSRATLGRKFRASATGDNPQLKRALIENAEGRMVVHYSWNQDYKETI